MKTTILFLLFLCILSSCDKDTLVQTTVSTPKAKERVMIVDSCILSTYPQFVVRYKVKRINLNVYATITLTNEIHYDLYDIILYSF